MRKAVLVLDFGSQTSQLIVRRVRDLGVYAELLPWDAAPEDLAELEPQAFILSGGPSSVYQSDAPTLPAYVLESGLPVLGICYGMHLLSCALGGTVEPGGGEFGHASFQPERGAPLSAGLPDRFVVWMSHGDRVTRVPEGFRVLGRTEKTPIAAMGNENTRVYGLQFHPEVTHTEFGSEILATFLFHWAGLAKNWEPGAIVQRLVAGIRLQVGEERVLCALSGGVDSAVVAYLLQQAIPGQFQCLFVDTGLLRRNEGKEVNTAMDKVRIPLHTVNAASEFFSVLTGITDPEEKRKRIGHLFVEVFARETSRLGQFAFLAQGTIYPDVVESRGKERRGADKIKTHHNVGGLPKDLPFRLLEPLRYFFKDEVRSLGRKLGLPETICQRQPFPGPGLAVRILGEVTEERVGLLQRADAIFREELDNSEGIRLPDQYFAVLLPVRAVGVMGDHRSYGSVLALRAVQTTDFMTADWSPLEASILGHISRRLVNELPAITRVVYDITSKPPATIEWE